MELTRPFAESGIKADFPVNADPQDKMSLEKGFTGKYALPPEENGFFIEMPQFNQLMYLTTKGVIDNRTQVENILSGNFESDGIPKLLKENLEWSVGSNSKYKNLKTAIFEAAKYINPSNFTITLKLTSDITLNENIDLINMDLRHIIIDGDNNTYKIQRAMTNSDTMFNVNRTYMLNFHYVTLYNSSQNKQGSCINNANLSMVEHYYKGLIIDGFNVGVGTSSASQLSYSGVTIQNCNNAISTLQSGNVCIAVSTIKNNTTGILMDRGSIVCIDNRTNTNFSNNTTNCNIAFNQLTDKGICIKSTN